MNVEVSYTNITVSRPTELHMGDANDQIPHTDQILRI
jgi:hypothetical protein